jgi:hypothetical protein
MKIELPQQLVNRRKLLLISAIVVGIWFFTVSVTGSAAMRALERYEIDSQTESLKSALNPAEFLESESATGDTMLAVRRLQWSLENVNDRLWFFRINSRVIGWVPFVGSNFRAAVDAFDQAYAIANSAEEILLATEAVIGSDLDGISLSTFLSVDNYDRLSLSIGSVRVHIEKSVELLDEAPNYSVADLPLLVRPVRSLARTSGNYYDQLRELTNWLSEIMAGIDSVTTNSRGMVEIVESIVPTGGVSLVDPSVVRLEFGRFLTGLEEADRHFQVASDLTPSLLSEKEITGDIRAALSIFHAARPPIESSTELVMAMINVLNLYNEPDVGGVTEGKLLSGLSIEMSGVEKSLIHELELLAEFMTVLDSERGNITSDHQALVRDIDEKLTAALSVLTTLSAFAGEIEKLVGIERRARYLLLGVNSDEIRASGGFVSNVWVLEFQDGALVSSDAFDVTELDNLENLDGYRNSSPELQLHMNAPITLMRDVTWDPHFPSVALQAIEIFGLSGEESDFNGVFLFNQNVFDSLVDAMGGVTTQGREVVGDGVLELLKTGTDEFGRGFIDQVFKDLISDLNSVGDAGVAFELVKSVSGSLKSRNLQLYLDDEKLQQRLEHHKIAGAMYVGFSDRIYVVDSNVGWSKSNQFVTRATDYRIDLSQPEPSAEILIKYIHSGSEVIAAESESNIDSSNPGDYECGDQFNFSQLSYEQLGNRCYWNLVRIFIPDGSVVTHFPKLPLSSSSVAVQTGRRRVKDETSSVSLSSDGIFISGLTRVGAREITEFLYRYAPPASIVQEEEGVFKYTLLLSPQPGIVDEMITVTVVLPDAVEITYSSHPLESVSPNTMSAKLVLDESSELKIEYTLSQ